MALPEPPDGALDVTYQTWTRYRQIVRVCRAAELPNVFNRDDTPARFRPFSSGRTSPIPTLYGANDTNGALGESIFHDIPRGGGPWTIPRASLYGRLRAVLVPLRPLRLVDLTGWAHKGLKIPGRALVDSDPAEYPITARWAERFHQLDADPD